MNGKIIIAFLLGTIITAAIILPKSNQNVPTAETPETTQNIVTAQATPEPVKILEYEKPEEKPEVEETAAEQEVEIKEEETTAEVTPEPTPSPEPEKVEVKAESTPKQTSSPQVKKTEPEYFYEDGKKYAIINGHKTYIASDDEAAVSSESYDWANDPAGQIKGPFN